LNIIGRTEEEITRYLLGQSSDEEQILLERRYLNDEGFLGLLLLAEDELIDAYIQGQLNEPQRAQFEAFYLVTDERREKVALAGSLRAYSQQIPKTANSAAALTQGRRSTFKPTILAKRPLAAAALAGGLLLIACGWLALEAIRLRSELERSKVSLVQLEEKEQRLQEQIAEERTRNEQLAAHLEELQNPAAPEAGDKPVESAIAVLVLTPGTTRDTSGASPLVLGPGIKTARLRLIFRDGDYQTYRATIRNPSNEEVWVQKGLKPVTNGENQSVVVSLPAALLKSDAYMLILAGVTRASVTEDVNDYQFRVIRK
jgi:cell division protein FtsB